MTDAALTVGPDQQRHVLHLFRRVMPGVAGVIVSSPDGHPLATDLHVDPSGLTARALTQHRIHHLNGRLPGASTLIEDDGGIVLVVFLDAAQAAAWGAGWAGSTGVPAPSAVAAL